MSGSGAAPLGASHPEVRELRRLLRSRRARDESARFVIEGPRVLRAALDRAGPVPFDRVYVAPEAAGLDVVAQCAARGIPVRLLGPGVAARVGDTMTSQGVFACCPLRRRGPDALDGASFVLVADRISDPGNAGTLVRSGAAAGVEGISLGPGSVDAYNPKVVRATAGAVFAVPIVEGSPTVEILERLGAGGLRRVGAVANGGTSLDSTDLTGPLAVVVGHEVAGLGALPLDALVTIPLASGTESLNVAMAATVVCFEARRQRRGAS